MDDEIMNDLSLPTNWKCRAYPNWRYMHLATTGHIPEPSRDLDIGSGNAAYGGFPEEFMLAVSTGSGTIGLMFLLSEKSKEISLVSVMSLDSDVDELLDRLRSHRPIYWWKKKATLQLVEQELTGLYAQSHIQADLATWKAVGERWTSSVQRIPVTRRRNRITDDRLSNVAKTYLDAEASGNPTLAVKEAEQVSYSTASHLVARARDAGKLPPWPYTRKKPQGPTDSLK